MKQFNGIALFFIILGFFVLTLPANHSEAEDAYHYARMTEQGAQAELFHSHHLLYLPLTRGVYRAAQVAGYNGRALTVLIGVSMVSGAWAVWLFAAILRKAGVKSGEAVGFAGLLLFSYGFWRYSLTAEIYIPVAALSLFAFYCALRGAEESAFYIYGAIAGGAALLLHLVAIPAVFGAVPVFYILKGRWRRAIGHAVMALLLVCAGYLAVQASGIRPVVYTDLLVPRGTLLEPATWLKAAVAWGQTIVSGNFLFGLPPVADRLLQLFPFHMLQEELFAGQQAPPWVRWAAPATFGLTSGLAVGMGLVLLRIAGSSFRRLRLCVALPETAAVFVWTAGLFGMALLFEPANPEMWISSGPPFWLLFALIWIGIGPQNGAVRRLPALLALLLFLHNWTGGLAVVKSEDGDYCRQKGLWLMEQARPGDVIVTADSHSFVTFLEYYTPAVVLDAKFAGPERVQAEITRTSGRVFVFDDVINLLPAAANRTKESVKRVEALADQLRPGLTLLFNERGGTVYVWSRPDGEQPVGPDLRKK